MKKIIDFVREAPEYVRVLDHVKVRQPVPGLGLIRSARLPVLAALKNDLNVPVLLVTDRADRALTLFDELSFWLPNTPRFHFPEPTPLFFEQAAWGAVTRRDRLQALTALAMHHLPGQNKDLEFPVIVAPLRALMTRTLPRRDFLVNSKTNIGTSLGIIFGLMGR